MLILSCGASNLVMGFLLVICYTRSCFLIEGILCSLLVQKHCSCLKAASICEALWEYCYRVDTRLLGTTFHMVIFASQQNLVGVSVSIEDVSPHPISVEVIILILLGFEPWFPKKLNSEHAFWILPSLVLVLER